MTNIHLLRCWTPAAGPRLATILSLQELKGISGVAVHFTQARSLCWAFCAVPRIHCAFQELARLYGNWSLIWTAFLSLWLPGSKGASDRLCVHSPVAPSRWKQLSVDTLITYPGHDTWHMSCNCFPCCQPLSLLFTLFLPERQSDHLRLRLNSVILLLKNTRWLPIAYGMSLTLW